VQIARIGVPPGVNSVYLAVTLLTNDGKLVRPPQWKMTHGGEPFLP
jgi:hypothetical protein